MNLGIITRICHFPMKSPFFWSLVKIHGSWESEKGYILPHYIASLHIYSWSYIMIHAAPYTNIIFFLIYFLLAWKPGTYFSMYSKFFSILMYDGVFMTFHIFSVLSVIMVVWVMFSAAFISFEEMESSDILILSKLFNLLPKMNSHITGRKIR